MQLREVCAAVPGPDQARQLLQRPAVALIRAPELLDVEPGLVGAYEAVEGSREELLAQLRVVLGLLGCGDHVGRPDRDVVGGIARAVHRGIAEVYAAIRLDRRLRHEGEGVVRGRAGDRPSQDPLQEVALLRCEARAVVAGGESVEQQLVREGLGAVAQSGVGDRVLVELQLVQVHEGCVERVEELRLEGEGLQVDEAVPELALDRVAQGAVQEAELAGRIVLGDEAEALEVVDQPVEALHALLQRAGDRLALGAGAPVPERKRRLQRLRPGRFDRLPRGEDPSLGKAPDLRARQVEAADVVGAEQVPGHQLQRLAAQGGAVQAFALREGKEPGHGLDAELRQGGAEVPAPAVQIVEKAPGAQTLQLLDPLVVPGVPRIAEHLIQVRSLSHRGPPRCPAWTRPRRRRRRARRSRSAACS